MKLTKEFEPPFKRSLIQIKTHIFGTVAWGLTETMLLTIVWWINDHIFSNFHTHFMRFLHNHMGGIVTPSTIALEESHSKRNWENNTKFIRVNKYNIPDPKGLYIRKGEVTILPTQEISNIILRSNLRLRVSYCFCRLKTMKRGKKCEIDAPLQTCLTLSIPETIEEINMKEPREDLVQKEEYIYNLLKRCEEIGLVHNVIFFEKNSTYVICNCCPCCCEVLSMNLKTKKEIGLHKKIIEKFYEIDEKIHNNHVDLSKNQIDFYERVKPNIKDHEKASKLQSTPIIVNSNFISETKENKNCINCGKCSERCYFEARYMNNGIMQYNLSQCTGCGLCVSTCPKDNIMLIKRKKLIKMIDKGTGFTKFSKSDLQDIQNPIHKLNASEIHVNIQDKVNKK